MNKFIKHFSVTLAIVSIVLLFTHCGNDTPHSIKTVSSFSPPAPVEAATGTTKLVTHVTLNPARTVVIDTEIGQNNEPDIQKILALGETKEPIFVVLKSPGGDVLSGAMILSAIEAAQGPVYTICDTLCASMAAIIFEHGTQRYMVDRSLVMFHPASGGAQGEVDKMVSRIGTIQRYIGKMEAYIANRVGISFEKYKELSGKELWLDAEDAVNQKYADAIVSIVLPPKNMQVVLTPEDQQRLNKLQIAPLKREVTIDWK